MLQQRISDSPYNTQAKYPKLSKQFLNVVATVFVSLLLSLGMHSAAFAVIAAREQANQVGNSFRETYPFHLQIIGLTPPLSDGSRVLLISEPPPHISPEYFQSIVKKHGGEASFIKHEIGYDGWTKDAVLALPSLNENELSGLLTKLHRDLFSSAYKANTVQLPVKLPPANNRSLDLSVSVGDLNNWLSKGDLKFTPTIGGSSRSLPEILSSGQSGVFISTQPGLVIWSIPRNQDLAKYRAEARQFFLDSDLIVGAVANERQLVIVARERVEPLLRLPPLRVETALMLATEESEDLAQSYEGLQLFASKLPNLEDWMPIYLSDSLIDTNFGSLLNITDQLLKSWSTNGSVKFANFDKYPKPSYWPPFERPMRELYKRFLVEGSGFIVFNWNTEGAGYTTSIGSYDFFALNRTGALPINYFTKSDSISANEEIAYEYFAGLGNSDFAQVVQYTALHQIFRKFGITTKETAINRSLLPGTNILESEAHKLLVKLQAIPSDELNSLVDENLQILEQGLQIAIQEGQLDPKIEINLRNSIPRIKKSIEQLHKEINYGTKRWENIAIPELSRLLASPRTYTPSFSDSDFENWLFSIVELISTDLDLRSFLFILLNVDVEDVKEQYVAALNDAPKTWIKTPSISLSRDKVDDISIYGGHNLSSKLTPLQADSSVPSGKVKIVGDDQNNPVILYNPNDVGKIHSLSREFAINFNLLNQNNATEYVTRIENLEKSLSQSLSQASSNPKLLPQALNLPTEFKTSPSQSGRGLTNNLEPPTSGLNEGWVLRNLTSDEVQRLKTADTLGTHSLIVERSPNGYTVLQSGSNQVVEAHTIDSLYNEVLPQMMSFIPSDNKPIQIYLNNFTFNEAKALTLTGDLRQIARQVDFQNNRAFSENVALLQGSYNWEQVNIKELKIERVSDLGYQHIIELEVMATTPDRPSLKLRIITFLKEITERVRAIIEVVLARPTSKSLNANQLIREINNELIKEFPDVDIKFELFDTYLTEPVRNNHLVRQTK